MAEALGFASSIVALVQLSASVYNASSNFYREAKEAKSKIGALATQTMNLSGVLQSLSLLACSPLFGDAGVSGPDFRDTYIESCLTTLNRINRKLDKAKRDFESGSHKKLITRSLKWPFASQETDDLIAELTQHRDVLQLALSADTMAQLLQCLANTSVIVKSVDSINQKLIRKESIDRRAELTAKREKVLESFLVVNPENHLQDCRRRRQPSTGRWLIERHKIFRNWISAPGSQVWLSGIPGAGKTILCAAVVDEILQEQSPSTAVAFFFCDYKYPESQKTVNVLAALAVQLAMQADQAFDVLDCYHEELHPHNSIKRPPEAKRLIEIVQAMVEHYDRVYIAVDGIDECGSNVTELLQSLKQLTRAGHVNMALFSRDEADIREELSDDLCIEIAAHTEDLELYVLAQMETRKRLGSLALRNPELHEHIRHTLIEGANGMFRWVACQLDHLDGLPSDGRRRKALTELPPTLFETYDRILDRIMQEDEHEQELCRKALHWIGLSYKEIDSRAMCEAISIQDDVDAVDKELLVDPDWVSRNCSSLIRLAGQDSDYPHFQLAHFTVKEYLRSIKPQSRRSSFRFSEDEAMQQLLRTSLRFLTFPIFDRKPTIASSEIQRMAQRNENHPFYPVAAGYIFCSGGYYWDDDFRDELSLLLQDEAMMGYATKLFSPEKTAIFLSWILQAMWYWPRVTRYEKNFSRIIGLLVAPEFSTLHVAAMLALPSICTHLIESEKVDLNIYCCLGTPLHALLAGVSFLFPGSFEYDKEIHYRWHHSSSKPAVYDQARQCVEIFVKHCADTSPQWNGINVFQMAIESSIRAEYQELWIEPLINPSTVVNDSCIESFKAGLDAGFTNRSMLDVIFTVGSNLEVPSGWARLASLVQTSRMLERDCERGDNPHDAQARLSDEDFNDGIQISLERRLTDTFGALIQDSRFRPDLFIWRENSKSVPILHFAIQYGNIRSVELLLEAGCDPGFVDESDGWTTLHECALCDTEDAEIATLLLKSGVTDSVTDKLGETCWHIAAENGNIPVLKVLIDLGSDTQQSLATISRAGRTPLASAIHNGEVESALLLLHHCNAELGAFQSDESLLDKAVAIGSDDLFPRLHEKLKLADAKESLQGSEPLENINLDCSPKLVEYLLTCWAVDSNSRSRALQKYLLDANTDGFDHPDQYPPRADMDHIIRRLLPPIGVADDDGTSPQHFWSIFCEKVVPHLTRVCNHEKHRCRMGLISMIFEILIDSGVLEPHDQNAGLPSYRLLFQALVDRGDRLNCSWVASVVQKVIEASSQPVDLLNEPVAHELLSQALRQSNVDLVCQLLDYGLDVHAAHGRLSTVEQSCYTSDLSMFHSIIEHSDKTLINRAGSHGKTLLHWAVSGTTPGYLNKIQELLKLGAKIDAKVDDPNTDTALTLASRSDRQDIVALLVSEGADPLHRGHDGWSILHAAALTGDLQYIQYLRLPDVPDSFWRGTCEYPLLSCDKRPHMTQNTAAIHLAAAKGRSNFLRFMSQHDVAFDVNAVTGYPTMTPLHLASLFGNLDVVELLVSAKANINARAAHGRLAIDFAALGGHLAVVKTLLKCGSETPSNDSSASIALLMSKERECTEDLGDSQAMARFRFEKSIIHGHLDHCKELVARGQSINAQLLTHSYTPLVRAVVQGQTSIVDWLVSMGVEVTNPVIRTLHPSLRCIASLTTHHIPSARTVAAVLDLALKQNVSWFQSILGPLHVAILDSKVEALDVILKHVRENDHAYRKMIDTEMVSLPADIIGWRGHSALSILASTFNRVEAFSNSSPWKQPIPPGSPLHWSIRTNNISAVKLLIENEADVNQVDSSGQTPMSLAVSSRHPVKILRELLQAGAGIAEPSRNRIVAMQFAIRRGDMEVVKILAEADPETLKQVDKFSADRLVRDAGSTEVFQYLVSLGSDPFREIDFTDSAITFHLGTKSSLRWFILSSGLVSQSSEAPLARLLASAAVTGDSGNILLIKKLYRTLSRSVFKKVVNRARLDIGSPLCLAASMNAAEMLKSLITMGTELESEGCRYGTPLMAACVWGNLDAVRCLVRAGALLCYANEEGLLRSAVSLSSRYEKITRWLLVDRYTDQQKLEYQSSRSTPHQAVWSGPRPFKVALPVDMHRDFGESRWSHLQRLQEWKEELLGSTLSESCRNSGLDFDAECEAESRQSIAQGMQRQFLARLGEDGCK